MIYRVEIDETYTNVVFDFDDINDAVDFAKTVISAGHRDDKHLKAYVSVIIEEDD